MRNSMKVALVAIGAAVMVAMMAIVVLRPQTTTIVSPAEAPAADSPAAVNIGRHSSVSRTSQGVVAKDDDKAGDSQAPEVTTTTTPPSGGGGKPPIHPPTHQPTGGVQEDPGPVVRDHRGEGGAPQGGVTVTPTDSGPTVRDHRHHDCPWYNPGC
jgi:hypothetical protein